MIAKQAPRGIRNHNPGNIRRSRDRWQGMAPQQTDAGYVQFIAPVWGIRALVKVLRNYRDKHGLSTVRAIIERWAPATENATESYIEAVTNALGVGPSEPFELEAQLLPLVKAIIHHENGVQPYADSVIRHAIRLADPNGRR